MSLAIALTYLLGAACTYSLLAWLIPDSPHRGRMGLAFAWPLTWLMAGCAVAVFLVVDAGERGRE